jgi:tyrosinase
VDPNLVGMHAIFANNMSKSYPSGKGHLLTISVDYTGCERCRDQAEAHKLVTGTIPLTGALGDKLGKYKIGSLEHAEVIPYLKKELHWRIQTVRFISLLPHSLPTVVSPL